jgi:pyruvate/2-oxoglutarate dehydrogenase complex dihydrolipoamide acyltransferase (E2) component
VRIDIVMHQVGEPVVEATLSRWVRQVGERVGKGEVIFEISTSRVDFGIPAPAEGVLVEVLVTEGSKVAAGTIMARMETESVEASRAIADRAIPSSVRRQEASVRESRPVEDFERTALVASTDLPHGHAVLLHEADASVMISGQSESSTSHDVSGSCSQGNLPYLVGAFLKAVGDLGAVGEPRPGGSRLVIVEVTAFREGREFTAIPGRPEAAGFDGLVKSIGSGGNQTRLSTEAPEEPVCEAYEITDLGSTGALVSLQRVREGYAARLGVGTVRKRAVVVGPHDVLDVRPMVYLSLTYDPRTIAPARAVRLMARVVFHLEQRVSVSGCEADDTDDRPAGSGDQ